MLELDDKLAQAAHHVQRQWSDERVDRVARATLRRRRRRSVTRAAVASLVLLVIAGGVGYRALAPTTLRFADGSTAEPLDRSSDVKALASLDGSGDGPLVELAHGGARFAAAALPGHLLRVTVGNLKVEASEARFVVERRQSQVRVAVEQGRVRVIAIGAEAIVERGEERLFDVSLALPAPERTPASSLDPVPGPASEASRTVDPWPAPHHAAQPVVAAHPRPATRAIDRTAWREPAEQGDFNRAYEELARSGPRAVRDVPAELLLAADVTRLSHHAAEAVPLLERVVKDHSGDPRAPLAAFTLGRVLLEELGRPQPAAAAFAEAQALAPTGPLASDALAREVEAWSRGGEMTRARARAQEYLRRFPKGARMSAVRRFGGIE